MNILTIEAKIHRALKDPLIYFVVLLSLAFMAWVLGVLSHALLTRNTDSRPAGLTSSQATLEIHP